MISGGNMLGHNKRKEELESRITELETSLDNLKKQLQEGVGNDSQKDIDHLEEYLDEISHRYSNLKDFWHIVSEELKEIFARKIANKGREGEG